MLDALKASKSKLSQYYSKTYQEGGDIYLTAIILSLEYKLTAFKTSIWEVHQKNNYWKQFIKIFYEQYDNSEALGTNSNSKQI